MGKNGRGCVGQKCSLCGVREVEREMGAGNQGEGMLLEGRKERDRGREGGRKGGVEREREE